MFSVGAFKHKSCGKDVFGVRPPRISHAGRMCLAGGPPRISHAGTMCLAEGPPRMSHAGKICLRGVGAFKDRSCGNEVFSVGGLQ